ncbi:MAG: endonuclease [Puniceicoccaceae bacterium]
MDYYAPATGLSGTSLKTALEDIIDGHSVLSYTPGVWEAHKDLYEDPDNPANLILFYSQASISKALQDSGSSPGTYFNREHLWPRSYGVFRSGADNTDLFHLVPVYKGVNSDRGNQYFDYSDPDASGYADPANSLAPECTEDSNSWEPADAQKGWVARAMLYMTTRYNYLELVDTPPSQAPATDDPRMAQLSVMLEWNRKFLPSAKETDVCQRIFDDYQGNRNPYIDFPEFADLVWVTGPSWGGWRMEHFSLQELTDELVSSDLADPDDDGLNNLMEMARYSDPRTPETEAILEFIEDSGSLVIRFNRASDASNLNLELILEESDNLIEWSTVDIAGATTTTLDSNRETVQVAVSIGSQDPRFFRLRANRPAL